MGNGVMEWIETPVHSESYRRQLLPIAYDHRARPRLYSLEIEWKILDSCNYVQLPSA